ncbi:MAG: hypothetical protein R2854_05805 [Caldilineaceae bacterium]
MRTLLHAGVRYPHQNLHVKYPDVDIILIQPQADDYRMFSYNPMFYGSRLGVAEHGFETVTVGLMENAEYFRQVLGRHNIELRTDLVERELDSIRASGESPEVVQQVIEGHGDAAHAPKHGHILSRAWIGCKPISKWSNMCGRMLPRALHPRRGRLMRPVADTRRITVLGTLTVPRRHLCPI